VRRLMDKLLLLHNALVINYRDIATSTARSIGLESVMYLHLYTGTDSDVDCFQFGFKSGHSTSMCTGVLKQTCWLLYKPW